MTGKSFCVKLKYRVEKYLAEGFIRNFVTAIEPFFLTFHVCILHQSYHQASAIFPD